MLMQQMVFFVRIDTMHVVVWCTWTVSSSILLIVVVVFLFFCGLNSYVFVLSMAQ